VEHYKIKEIYYTIQGEGYHSGRPAVFCRFSGCNLWSGREVDRHKAICQFCDTDFWGTDGENGGLYTASDLVKKIISLSPMNNPFVVCTGGEPALQIDKKLIETFHDHNISMAIETNGTKELQDGIDWICVSPKANTEIVVTQGNELKLVYPQRSISPADFENSKFDHFYLQPMDSPSITENTRACVEYCKEHPKWKLSIQSHKYINIP